MTFPHSGACPGSISTGKIIKIEIASWFLTSLRIFPEGMQQLQSHQGSSSKPRVLQPITKGPTGISKEHGLPSEDASSELFVVPNRKPILPPIGSNKNDKTYQSVQEESTKPATGSTRRKSKISFTSNEADSKNEERNTQPTTSSDYIGPAPSTYYVNDTNVMQQEGSTERVYKSNPPCFALGMFAGVLGLLTLTGGIVMTTIGYLSNGKTAIRINGIVFIILGLMLILFAYLYFCVVVSRHARLLKRQLEKKKQNKKKSPRGDHGIKKSRDEINRMFRVKTYTRNDVWGTG